MKNYLARGILALSLALAYLPRCGEEHMDIGSVYISVGNARGIKNAPDASTPEDAALTDAGTLPDASLEDRCDGKDNNANGLIDEIFPVGISCYAGVRNCRREGIYVCAPDQTSVVCTADREYCYDPM